MLSRILKKSIFAPRLPILGMIRFYQTTLSPDHGIFKSRHPFGYCKFYPTCSEYAHEAVKRFGVVRGCAKAGWRILRCNPWTKGGVDEIVEEGRDKRDKRGRQDKEDQL